MRFGGKYPVACRKTLEKPYWINFIPQSKFPFVFDIPLFKNTRFLGEKRRFLKKHVETYEKLVDYIGPEDVYLTKSFYSRHWFILCLLKNGGPYSRNFVQLNPALSYLLSAHAIFHPLKSKKYWRSIRSLLLKPRKDILAYFGFPRRNAVVKIFDKLTPEMYSLELFFWLRKELKDRPELIRELSFFPYINTGSITLILSGLSKFVHYELIDKISRGDKEKFKPLSYFDLKDIVRMHETLREYNVHETVPSFGSRFQIKTYHDFLVTRMDNLEIMINIEYPKSRLQDIHQENFEVEKIEDSYSLHVEGEIMHHCIFSYEKELMRGGQFAARVIKPQRLTVLYMGYFNTYRLIEVRGINNSDAEPAAMKLIKDWLSGFTEFDNQGIKQHTKTSTDQLSLFGEENEMSKELRRGVAG